MDTIALWGAMASAFFAGIAVGLMIAVWYYSRKTKRGE